MDSTVTLLGPGAQLGPYQILGLLGSGGMGHVYKGRDTRLDRMVAIKTDRQRFTARFEREARAASALNHPHICAVHDVGEWEIRSFLVMELQEGKTLREYAGGKALETQMINALGTQIADALEETHAKGVVHVASPCPAREGILHTDAARMATYSVVAAAHSLANRSLRQAAAESFSRQFRLGNLRRLGPP